ncbi:similar to Saccharomyces cerevisiae YDR379W RGA2 GTPase- activating protein for the polarity-establishment protein Cdc42p [Maudiozyma barnettii]|uniref:Similar to Saccharomyces cerevisiae YDR379W RGA2 GTPase- activating protein for the polarity-establishment protein Cdc42p n=1 Tax=Maudiozyma barnettii TaxID=61262 RepID=A0A8H2VDU7_9SACH|nr:GTPase-activating protein RGA2 [Kazachstania barnettii]CAB4253745.1 similar to Saccharomyces cerevisiae YDR379W RGA2 GTPase- activating protein for the polarity-establishment protein Cdc42p [Kazachstania barnettii]CAD1781493.1 similar to Saccharomyces cerevisiae YDR379W RGA2 GTPase- activating protein for the polarity-establishment protein Cdc42p [Kazachstania barnettii]
MSSKFTSLQQQQPQPEYTCIKCNKQIQSGNFYTINDFHYHNDCFHCFKCQKSLAPHGTADNNDKLLVLENGTLICSDCSDSCKRCGKKIYDLAIILSNNEAYCPECFRCTKCDKEISDLKYAKTKNGIFCVDCHQVLLQKRRLHKEKLLNKQKNNDDTSNQDNIAVPIRSPSRNRNRDNPIYSKIPNTLPKLIPKNTSSSSSSISLLSSMVSNQSIASHRTTNSTTDASFLKEPTGLKRPPTLVKDPTFSTMKDVSSTYDDAESRPSTEHLDLENRGSHARNVSIDDMLNATLDHDEEFKDSDENIDDNEEEEEEDDDEGEHDATDRSFMHYTPVKHNMESIFSENSLIDTYDHESMSRTPEPIGIIPQVLPELPTSIMPDIDHRDMLNTPKLLATPSSKNATSSIPLNSPMAIDSRQPGQAKGLALDLPMFSFEDKDLYRKRSQSSNGNTGNGAPHHKESLQNVFSGDHNEDSYNNHNVDNDDDDDKIIQIRQDNNVTSNSAPQSSHKNKKLNRSFSLRNNKFFNGFRNKSSESPKNIPVSPNNNSGNMQGAVDTHSGWGVTNNNTSKIVSKEKPRNSFKGNSDTLIYHRHNNDTDTYNTSNGPISISSPIKVVDIGSGSRHARAQSTTSQSSQTASNIAMFRTPPLDNTAIFKRGGASSTTSTDHSRSKSYDASTRPQHTISKEIPELPNTPSTDPIHESNGNMSLQSTNGMDSNKIAAHHRSISWQTALHLGHKGINETDENVDPEELPLQTRTSLSNKRPSSRGELLNYEIKLRNAKLELKSIENSKQQLLIEIESLEQYKKNLVQDINQAKKVDLIENSGDQRMNSLDNGLPSTIRSGHSRTGSVTNDMNVSSISTPMTYTASSPQSTSKQKFWKIFGKESNGNHQRNKTTTPLNFSNSSGNLQDSIGSATFNSFKTNSTNSNNGNDMTLMNSNQMNISPNRSNISGLQEIVLTDLCRYEDTAVPHLITTCIDYIESRDELLQIEGIYRKSGSQVQIENIEKELYTNNNINYKFPNDIDINVVTNILKRFLRNLKNPVITFELYDPLIQFVKDNEMIQKLSFNDNQLKNHDPQLIKYINGRLQSLLFQQMPREHLNLLQILVTHVNKIANWKEENLMSLHNLSLVFAPSLIHDLNFEKDIVDMKERNYLIEYLFTYKIIV